MNELRKMMISFFFIDEYTIVWCWWSHWFLDASNMFKPALAREERSNVSGATTLDNTDSILKRLETCQKDNCRTNFC
jgi:ATP-dependent Clp protease ATP-binding subunit ClpA